MAAALYIKILRIAHGGAERHILGVNCVVCELQFSKLVPKSSQMADHKHLKSSGVEHLPSMCEAQAHPGKHPLPQKVNK